MLQVVQMGPTKYAIKHTEVIKFWKFFSIELQAEFLDIGLFKEGLPIRACWVPADEYSAKHCETSKHQAEYYCVRLKQMGYL